MNNFLALLCVALTVSGKESFGGEVVEGTAPLDKRWLRGRKEGVEKLTLSKSRADFGHPECGSLLPANSCGSGQPEGGLSFTGCDSPLTVQIFFFPIRSNVTLNFASLGRVPSPCDLLGNSVVSPDRPKAAEASPWFAKGAEAGPKSPEEGGKKAEREPKSREGASGKPDDFRGGTAALSRKKSGGTSTEAVGTAGQGPTTSRAVRAQMATTRSAEVPKPTQGTPPPHLIQRKRSPPSKKASQALQDVVRLRPTSTEQVLQPGARGQQQPMNSVALLLPSSLE